MNETATVPLLSGEPDTEISDNQKSKRRKLIAILLVVISLFSVGSFLLLSQSQRSGESVSRTIKNIVNKPLMTPTPTPFTYQEMTIPSLREKEYNSSLSQLNPVDENDAYISYETTYRSEGLTIHGWLTKPKGDMPKEGWPAIVFVHGYIPPKSYETRGQAYSSYVDYLARNGFVVFKIDLRGHGRSEGEPGGAYYSGDYVIDTLNAYTALQKHEFVNSKAVGMWGHSMAGNILLRSFAVKPDIPAVVIWGGAGFTYIDLNKYGITDNSFDPSQSSSTRMKKREQIRKLYGNPDLTHAFWKQLSPAGFLTELQGSLSLHHAQDDEVVTVNYSKDLNTLLEKTSVRHEYFEYPSGGHNISGENFILAMERTVIFYKNYLK